MNDPKFFLAAGAAALLVACGEAANGQTETAAETGDAAQDVADAAGAANDAEQKFDAISGAYTTDANHRYITFSYLHQGYSRPHVRWDDWTGVLQWDADSPENSSVEVVIDAASVNSGVSDFNDHLKSADFFEVEKYPQITFKSTSVERTGATTGRITGDLTIKDVTKPVTLDVTFNKAAHDERNKLYKIGFSAAAAIKRTDFDVGLYAPFVGDDVSITIETEFQMPAEG